MGDTSMGQSNRGRLDPLSRLIDGTESGATREEVHHAH